MTRRNVSTSQPVRMLRGLTLLVAVFPLAVTSPRAEEYKWNWGFDANWDCALCWGHGFGFLANGVPPNDRSATAIITGNRPPTIQSGYAAVVAELHLRNAVMNLNGSLLTYKTFIGDVNDSPVALYHNGSSFLTDELQVSNVGGGMAELHLGGYTTTKYLVIGDNGLGLVNHSLGITNIGAEGVGGTLTLGKSGSGKGFYEMSRRAGQTALPELNTVNVVVGAAGIGTFTQRAGVSTFSGSLILGSDLASDGSFELSETVGTTSTVNAGHQLIGNRSSGTFTQKGGTNNTFGSMIVGVEAHGIGNYTHQNGLNHVRGDLVVSLNGGSVGRYGMSDAINSSVLKVDGFLHVGAGGKGNFEQTGGAVTALNRGLWLGSNAGGDGTYLLHAGVLRTDQTVLGFDGVGTFAQGGGEHVTHNRLRVGWVNRGTYELSAGTLRVGVGSPTGELRMAEGAASVGSFIQNGGVFQVNRISTGAGTSFLELNGGVLQPNPTALAPTDGVYQRIAVTTMTVGGRKGSYSGAFTLTGVVDTTDTRVGLDGVGSIVQTGGQHTVQGQFQLGRNAGGQGEYRLVEGKLTAAAQYIGWDGIGSFVQLSGSNRATASLALGAGIGSTGSYELHGGSLVAPEVIVGYQGSSAFHQLGGDVGISGNLYLGVTAGVTGTYRQSAGVNTADKLILGERGIGTYTLDAGTLNVRSIVAGDGRNQSGRGGLELNGGSLNLVQRSMGLYGLTLAGPVGTSFDYALSAGQSLTVIEEIIGGAGSSRFSQTGGTHVVDSLVMGRDASGSGIYELKGGSLSVTKDIAGVGTRSMLLDGGVLNLGRSANLSALSVGSIQGTSGSLQFGGDAQLDVRDEQIGNAGRGVVTQTGGAHWVGDLTIGPSGSFAKSAGSLSVLTSFSNAGAAVLSGGGVQDFRGSAVNSGTLRFVDTSASFSGDYKERGALTSSGSHLRFVDVTIDPDGAWEAAAGDHFLILGSVTNGSARAGAWKTDGATLAFEVDPARFDHEDLEDGLVTAPISNFMLAGSDRGASEGGYLVNFSWYRLALGRFVTLHLGDGNATNGAALYVRVLQLDGGTDQLDSIRSDFNIYYDASVAENAYLNSGTFAFDGRGRLIPIAAAVPEPGTWILLAGGGLIIGTHMRRRREPVVH